MLYSCKKEWRISIKKNELIWSDFQDIQWFPEVKKIKCKRVSIRCYSSYKKERKKQTVGQFLRKLNTELSYDPAIPCLGYIPKELKIYVHTKTCTWMFIAVLFTIAKKWKTKCPPNDACMNKMWYMHILEYHSAIKRNGVQTDATWMNTEKIMLSERSQTQKSTDYIISFIW